MKKLRFISGQGFENFYEKIKSKRKDNINIRC